MKWNHGKAARNLAPGDALDDGLHGAAEPLDVVVDVVRAGEDVEVWMADSDRLGMPSFTVSGELIVPCWEPDSEVERRLILDGTDGYDYRPEVSR
jgi:hypothetical protein